MPKLHHAFDWFKANTYAYKTECFIPIQSLNLNSITWFEWTQSLKRAEKSFSKRFQFKMWMPGDDFFSTTISVSSMCFSRSVSREFIHNFYWVVAKRTRNKIFIPLILIQHKMQIFSKFCEIGEFIELIRIDWN